MNQKNKLKFFSDPTNAAIAIALIFFVFSVLWIPFSEWVIRNSIKRPSSIEQYEDHIKIVFRIIVSGILFFLIRQKLMQLKQAHERAQNYLNVAEVILLALNSKGEIQLINPKGCGLLGVNEEEVIGQNWFDQFIPEENRGRAYSRFKEIMKGQLTLLEHMEGKIRSFKGQEYLIGWHHSVLKDEKGRIIGTLSSGEDITEQRKLETEVLEIREKEQQRIGQDLHDSLGQNLTAVTYMGQLLQKRLSSKGIPEANDAGEVVKLVGRAIDQVRGLARGLYPIEISKNGFVSALQDLASTTEMNHSVRCVVSINQKVPFKNDAAEIQLYRITQEALNNALKHGQAKNIQIRLETDEEKVILSVQDDGKGMKEIENLPPGMGLNTMRYRANLIGGSLDIRSKVNEGTTVLCQAPHPRESYNGGSKQGGRNE